MSHSGKRSRAEIRAIESGSPYALPSDRPLRYWLPLQLSLSLLAWMVIILGITRIG